MHNRIWTITIEFEEGSEQTEAQARLVAGDQEYGGWGRARRNPHDPDIPKIGEELATARALTDLAHHLFEKAVSDIESFEGHEINVHL